MNKNKNLKNIVYTTFANLLNMIIGIVTGLIIPKFLGVQEFAYFKIFTFYLTYVGLMHFGFVDGIYIKYGKYDYEELPKKKFRLYFIFLFISQVVIFIVGTMMLTTLYSNNTRKIIYIFILLNMIFVNLIAFFTFISQFTKRFKLYSFNLIASKVIFVIGICIVFFLGKRHHFYFIIVQTVSNVLILVSYIAFNKELVLGSVEKVSSVFREIKAILGIGIFVLIGNFVNIIIFGLDRLFIDKFFDLNTFAMYSFAFSIISLFYLLLNGITAVIYPYLARKNEEKWASTYIKLKIILISIIGLSMSGFFVLKFIIIRFLSDYASALNITTILMATILFGGQNSIIVSNYYKVMNLEREYTKNNLLGLLLGILTNIVAYLVFKSASAIAYASLLTFILWLGYSDYYFVKKLKLRIFKEKVLELLVIGVFFITAYNFNWYSGMIIYIALLISLFIIIERKEMVKIIKN